MRQDTREALEQGTPNASLGEHLEMNEGGADDQQEFDVPVIYGTNGQPVTCTYVNHPAWNESINICMTLHFIMLTLGPTRSSSWCYSFRLTIRYFLDFVIDYNHRHPSPLHIVHIRDITPSTFRSFSLFLDEHNKTRLHAGLLKSAINTASKETEVVPQLELPVIKQIRASGTEPLSEEGVASLTLATRKNTDAMRQTIKRRKEIDASAPYTYEELQALFDRRFTKEEVLIWVKYKVENGIEFNTYKALSRLNKCDDPEIVELRNAPEIIKSLKKMAATNTTIKIPKNYQPNIRKRESWHSTVLDPHRVVKTFNEHGFPFKFNIDDLRQKYSGSRTSIIEECDDSIKLILNKLHFVRAKFNRFYGRQGQYMMSLDEHFGLYYPTAIDMAGLATLMMLQAGWNKETIMEVDKDNFEHPLTSIIEESIKIICSEKFRSQGSNVPYADPKQILAASDADNPYSLYNLILLAKEFTAPLASFLNGIIDPYRNRQVNTLFVYVRPSIAWTKSEGATGLATLDYAAQFSYAMREFLEHYEVIDNGKRLTSSSEITRRLRVSWLFYNAETAPFAFLSQLLGHQSRDTTDQSYDNSSAAHARRLKRLRSALEHIVDLLRARKFKGLLGKRANTQATTKLSIFFLPGLERPLWACGDRYKPDWPGAPKLTKGSKCVALEQCFFCSRVWILEDSLPYLIERLAHIDELLRDGSVAEFGNRLEAEQEEINAILAAWPDGDAIDEALQFRTMNSPLLPRNLRDLRLIFKTGDLDE